MPKRMPIETPASDEATDLDDVLERAATRAAPTRNWTTLFTGMNPLRAKFWKSLDKNSWDTLEGLYEAFRFYREPIPEEEMQDVRKGMEKGKSFEEARKAVPKFKWQIPAILPTAAQITKELLGNRPVKPFLDRGIEIETETPVLDEVLDYAAKTTGIGALLGDDAAKQEFYKLFEDDPFAFWGWILPIIGQMKKVRMVGTAGKITRGIGTGADIIDMPLIEGVSNISKSLLKHNHLKLPADMSNVPFKVKYGQDTKTGEALASTVTSEEMAGRAGLDPKNVPPTNYPKGAEGRDSTVMKQRFDKTKEAIQKADQRSWSIESFDISKVGDALSEAYEGGQYGLHGGFRRKFDTLGKVLIQPLKLGEDFALLGRTRALLEELRAGRGSKLMSAAEVEIIDKTLAQTFDAIVAEAEGQLTIADMDAFRFRFRKKVKGVLEKEGLSGDSVQKIYGTLTEDFYDLIENEVNLAPDNFPENFIDEVTQAKADYQRIAALGDSAGAKLIRKHYDAPHKLVAHILNGNSTRKSIADMKTLLGEEMWGQLQAGFLQRLFDASRRKKEFRWDGLKREIEKINASDENRLRLIFGDERAKELAELGEWSAKFASEGTAAGLINKLVADGNQLPDLLHRLVDLVDFRGPGIEPKGVSVTTAAVIYLGKHAWQQYLESDGGLEWLREGHHWRVATKDNEVITITPGDFVEAVERQKIRGMIQVPKDIGKKQDTHKRVMYKKTGGR